MNTFEDFTWFQILLSAGLAVILAACLAALGRRWITIREACVGVMVCFSGAVATIWPDLTVKIANKLGIGRGADLIFYCAVVVMMIGFWMTYIRLRHLRREITLLVRHLAIAEAEREIEKSSGASSPREDLSG